MYAFTSRSGLGATPQQIAGITGSIGIPIATAVAAPALATALGISAAIAVPIVGAAFAGVMIGIQALLNSGCGQTCIVTSQWANQAEQLLTQNLDAYFSIPAPRPESARQTYLALFNAVWQGLVQRCSQGGLGTAGQNCIADRQRGACKWRQTAGAASLRYPGEPQPGECWNWFTGYLDPVANDPNVVPDSALAQVSGVVSSAAGSLGISPMLLMLALGLVAAAVIL